MVVQLIFSVIMSDEDHDVDVESDVGVLIIYPFVVLYCIITLCNARERFANAVASFFRFLQWKP